MFLVWPTQLHVFCLGEFIATLWLSRRVVSHKDFQMPCVKFLISPTILKYIITQTQTSFKKYLSLKHVWPPCLDLKRFFFFSLLFKPYERPYCSTPQGPNADLTDVSSNTSSCVTAACCTMSVRKPASVKRWCLTFRKLVKVCVWGWGGRIAVTICVMVKNRDLKGTHEPAFPFIFRFSCSCKCNLLHQKMAVRDLSHCTSTHKQQNQLLAQGLT